MAEKQQHQPQSLVVVCDGGGTTTRCAVARRTLAGAWEELARGLSGASNPGVVGAEQAVASVAEAWSQARTAAALGPVVADRAVVALAGTLRSDVREEMTSRLASIGLAREVRVVPDLLPILYAVEPTGKGLGLIAGTGSVAFARDDQGRLAVRGGWGYLLGDEGSGYWLGREGVRRLLGRMEAGLVCDGLDELICRELGAHNSDEVKRAIYASGDPRQQIARLARPIIELTAEEAGAMGSEDLLDACAAALALLVEGLAGGRRDGLVVAASGGLFTGCGRLAQRLERALSARGLTSVVIVVRDPLEGCLAISLEEEFRRPLLVG